MGSEMCIRDRCEYSKFAVDGQLVFFASIFKGLYCFQLNEYEFNPYVVALRKARGHRYRPLALSTHFTSKISRAGFSIPAARRRTFNIFVLALSRCCRSHHGSYQHIVFVLLRLNGNHVLLRLFVLFATTIVAICKGTHRSPRVSKHGRIEVGSNRRVCPYRGQKQEVVALCPPMANQGLRGEIKFAATEVKSKQACGISQPLQ